MAGRTIPFKKTLTAADRNDRFSVPAMLRDHLFPHVVENGKVKIRALDEKGDVYEFVMRVRKNRTKPEFMARGWQRFVRTRKLFPEDIVFFYRSEFPDTFRVEVQEVGPKLQLALVPQPEKPALAENLAEPGFLSAASGRAPNFAQI